MKNCKYLIACLVLLSVCMPSFGQEFIKRTPLEKSDSIIIRDVSGDSWLVYSHFAINEVKHKAFVLFAEADATAEIMYLPDHVTHVNDFEIYDDKVYFAGDDRNGIGIMGYFDLTTFPTTTVNICTVPVMATFERLDVGVYNNTLHVFLTGEELLGGGHFVDAWLNGTNVWQFDISINLDKVNRFDDVAALSSGVAVSGRKEIDKDGFIFLFPLPAAGPAIFPAYAHCLCFPSLVSGNILLDAGSGDDLSFVFQHDTSIDGEGSLHWNTLIRYNRSEQACFNNSSLPYGTPDYKVHEKVLSFAGYSFDIEAIGEKCQDAIIPVTTECDENNTDR